MTTTTPGNNGSAPFVSKPLTQVPPNKEQPPKRKGPGRPPTKSLEAQIGALIVMVNLTIQSIPPLRQDAMDVYEMEALAKAIDLQAKTSPRFRRYLEALLSAGSGAGLIGIMAMIGARRAARHGLMPAEVDALLGSMIQGATRTPAMPPAQGEPANAASAPA